MEENQKILDDIKSRLSQLEENRARFIDRWKDAQNYVAPHIYNWSNLDAIPEVPKRYSSAPCYYKSTLVSGLVGYSISPHIQWFKLSLEDQRQLDLYGVKDFLESCEERLTAEFNRSNLYSEAAKMIEDGVIIGHGVMMMERDLEENKLRYTTIRANEIYLDVNEKGEIDTCFRKYIMTLRNLIEFFGEENVSERLRTNYQNKTKWNDKIEVLFAVYPRKEYKVNPTNAKEMQYAAIYVDTQDNLILKESGFNEFPFAIFEWAQIPGLAYSTSPAMNAIEDIKFLNIARKSSMEICQTSANPPMRVSNTIRNLSIVPKGMNYITSADEIIEPIKTGENYPINLQIVEEIKQSVKDWFNVDFFLMLQAKQGQMTATEVMELQGEKSAVLSNLIVTLNIALRKIIQRSFNLCLENGIFDAIPESLAGTNAAVKVDFVGPLAQSQKRYHTSGGITQALQQLPAIMQMNPEAIDYIDTDELVKRAMTGAGMPERIIREDDDVKEMRKTRAQAQAQAVAQQQQQDMAKELMKGGNLTKAPEQGSALQMMNSQLAGAVNGNQ